MRRRRCSRSLQQSVRRAIASMSTVARERLLARVIEHLHPGNDDAERLAIIDELADALRRDVRDIAAERKTLKVELPANSSLD